MDVSKKYFQFLDKKYSHNVSRSLYSFSRTILKNRLFDNEAIKEFCMNNQKSKQTYYMYRIALSRIREFSAIENKDIHSIKLVPLSNILPLFKIQCNSTEEIILHIQKILEENGVSRAVIHFKHNTIKINW